MDSEAAQETFSSLVRAPEDELDLVRAALTLSAAFNPLLDIETALQEFESIAAGLVGRLPPSTTDRVKLEALVRYLVEELGFRGDSEHYEDPRNSFLDQVLARRLGIPITLSVVFIETARRNGLQFDGVGYPGHFLVRWTDAAGEQTYLDPFHGGRVLRAADLVAGLTRAGMAEARAPQFLSAVTKRQILTRMLNNLKAVFAKSRDLAGALQASELLLTISPWDLEERRDHGLLAVELGRHAVARTDLETYLTHRPDAHDAGRVQRLLAGLWADRT